MHFFVHASASALAPLTPHLESLIQPFTVWTSAANDTEATNTINAPASTNKRNFCMSSSFRLVPTHDSNTKNFITGGQPANNGERHAVQPALTFRSGRCRWVASAGEPGQH